MTRVTLLTSPPCSTSCVRPHDWVVDLVSFPVVDCKPASRAWAAANAICMHLESIYMPTAAALERNTVSLKLVLLAKAGTLHPWIASENNLMCSLS
jgi:hypothetical protein